MNKREEQITRIVVFMAAIKSLLNKMTDSQLDETEAWLEISLEQMKEEVGKHGA